MADVEKVVGMSEGEIRVSRSEYFHELGLLSGKARRRKTLRSEYFSHLGRLSGHAREKRRFKERRQRYPSIYLSEKVVITRRLEKIAMERKYHLARMKDLRKILADLQSSIEQERARVRRKIVPPPPPKRLLHRIKIRLYNFQRKPTPTGVFQTFWEIDAIIDPETGLVDWDWWLTSDEVQIAKYHMVGYFKGMAKWRSPEQMSLAYFNEPKGIAYETEMVRYKRSKNVPSSFIARAEGLTVGEMIVGISSQDPQPVDTPEGVYFEEAMIIDADGGIKWHEKREKFVWRPTANQIEKVKKELGIK